ncbi:MAG TPA: DUF935 family protein [Candidatus Angelobacter sp.]|nr:DUF935 family protein [Candidatus Angelobacter sp.]
MSQTDQFVDMSAADDLPAKAPKGALATPDVLEGVYRTTLSLANAFVGVSDPTVIWTAMIRDFRTAFLFYRELEEKDDDVGSALEMLKLAVLSREWQILPGDESGPAQDAAQFCKQQVEGLSNFRGVLEALLDAAGYGLSISEVIYDVSSGQAGLSSIHDLPQELFSFNPQYMMQSGPLRLLKNPYAVDGGDLVPEEKFLIFSFRPRSGNRRGRPLLRRVFWPSWFKRQTVRFWLRFAEKGPGTAAVMYQPGATDDEKSKALAAAEAMIEKVAIAVPSNFQVVKELLTSSRTQNPGVYEKLHDKMNYKIARVILGQTLTTYGNEGGTGSRSQGDVHRKMFFLKDIELAGQLETIITNQLLRRLTIWNFGPNVPTPKFLIDKEDEEDLVQRIGIDSEAQAMGVPIPKKYMQSRYGIPEPGPQDQVLSPSGAPGAPISSGAAAISSLSDAVARHNLREVRSLLGSLQGRLGDLYKKRIHEVAEGLRGGSIE